MATEALNRNSGIERSFYGASPEGIDRLFAIAKSKLEHIERSFGDFLQKHHLSNHGYDGRLDRTGTTEQERTYFTEILRLEGQYKQKKTDLAKTHLILELTKAIVGSEKATMDRIRKSSPMLPMDLPVSEVDLRKELEAVFGHAEAPSQVKGKESKEQDPYLKKFQSAIAFSILWKS